MTVKKKKKRLCLACDGPLRKGVARRALVIGRGEPLIGLCCIKCIISMLPIVTAPHTVIAPLCVGCKRDRASTCGTCVAALEQNVRELSKANITLQQELQKVTSELHKLAGRQT